jgi:hypothetical protein
VTAAQTAESSFEFVNSCSLVSIRGFSTAWIRLSLGQLFVVHALPSPGFCSIFETERLPFRAKTPRVELLSYGED